MEHTDAYTEIETVYQLEWVGGVLVGRSRYGVDVCRFKNYADAVLGHPMLDDLNSRKTLFVFVDKSALTGVPQQSITTGWHTIEDYTGKDQSDSVSRDTNSQKKSPPMKPAKRVRKTMTYEAKKLQQFGDDDRYRVLTSDGLQLYIPQGYSVKGLRSVTFREGSFLHAVPRNIGRGGDDEKLSQFVYGIKLCGDDKWKIGFSRDGFRAIEQDLKHPDNNNFYKSLQECGLKGCRIFVTGFVHEKSLVATRKFYVDKFGRDNCYLYKKDSFDFDSQNKTYCELSGFKYADHNGVLRTITTDNILSDLYEVYMSERFYEENDLLKIILI